MKIHGSIGMKALNFVQYAMLHLKISNKINDLALKS